MLKALNVLSKKTNTNETNYRQKNYILDMIKTCVKFWLQHITFTRKLLNMDLEPPKPLS